MLNQPRPRVGPEGPNQLFELGDVQGVFAIGLDAAAGQGATLGGIGQEQFMDNGLQQVKEPAVEADRLDGHDVGPGQIGEELVDLSPALAGDLPEGDLSGAGVQDRDGERVLVQVDAGTEPVLTGLSDSGYDAGVKRTIDTRPPQRTRRGSPLHGFTLIEALIVISLISLLIAILLPALGQAREIARAAVCMSNLRQIGIMSVMYQDDFGGSLAGGDSQIFPEMDFSWTVHLAAYHSPYKTSLTMNQNMLLAWRGLKCPSSKWTEPSNHYIVYDYAYNGQNNYGFQGSGGTWGEAGPSMILDAIQSPGSMFLLCDGFFYLFPALWGAPQFAWGNDFWGGWNNQLQHIGFAKVLYADGHVGQRSGLTGFVAHGSEEDLFFFGQDPF